MRGLRKSRAPISGFDSPSRASRAICRSCASQLVARLDGSLAHLLARRQQLTPGALGERLHADRHEQLVCRAELLARVDPAALAAQPFAVEQVSARELRPQPRAAQPLDRLAIEGRGSLALAQQRAGAGLDAERPVGGRDGGGRGDPFERARARARGSSHLVAASSISIAAQTETNSSGVSSLASRAAASASSYRPRPLRSTERAQRAYWTAVPWPPAVNCSIVASISSEPRPRGPGSRRARGRRTARRGFPWLRSRCRPRRPAAAALPSSPPSTTACAITLTLTASTVSAPASRASSTPRVATARQVS